MAHRRQGSRLQRARVARRQVGEDYGGRGGGGGGRTCCGGGCEAAGLVGAAEEGVADGVGVAVVSV